MWQSITAINNGSVEDVDLRNTSPETREEDLQMEWPIKTYGAGQ